MEKQIICNIHGYPIIVNLFITTKNSNRFSYSCGQININVSKNYDPKYLETMFNKVMKEKMVSKFYSQPFIGKDYIDLLGNHKRLVVLEENMNSESFYDMVVRKREDIIPVIKKYYQEILEKEVRKYEKIMNIPIQYDIKITNMRSCMGKNYFKKHLLTFDLSLVHFSLEIIDSVIIHELTHYFFQNHSINFYNKLLYYCPNYEELKEKLTFGVRK